MVGQVYGVGRQRRATFAHILVDAYVIVVFSITGEHVSDVGIVHVLGFADGSQGFDVEVGTDFEVQAQFYSVIFLVDAGERNVREGVLGVIIEHRVLGGIVHPVIIGVQVGVEPAVLELVANLGTEVAFVFQVFREVVVDLRGRERRAGRRSFPLVAYTQNKSASLSEVEGGSGLAAAVEEFCRSAFTIRVIYGQTVPHLSVALHGGSTQSAVHEEVNAIDVDGVAGPCLCLVHEDVIIVAEAVAFINTLAAIVDVVHSLGAIGCVGVFYVCVYIIEIGGAEQILQGLVVHALVGRQR